MSDLVDRFMGSALCGAIGDALGAKYEWQSYRQILQSYPHPEDLFKYTAIDKDFFYSDDTQSSIGITESLLKDWAIEPEPLMKILSDNYDAWRGYGTGFRKIINAYASGTPVSDLASIYFTDGSYGNGAAMRVGPIGLLFSGDHEARRIQVEKSCKITHSHADAIEGAQIIAGAVAYAVRANKYDPKDFKSAIMAEVQSADYDDRMEKAFSVNGLDDLIDLGSDISALESVPAAVAAVVLHPADFMKCIGTAIQIGGDTDTVASMAGNIFGAINGPSQIPSNLLDALERDNPDKGVAYIKELWSSLSKVDLLGPDK